MGKTERWTVPEKSGRIDAWLAEQVEYSRSEVARWCKDGLVFVDGKRCKASLKLKGGETITAQIPEAPSTDIISQPLDLDILYMDDEIIVVNKPAGLVVHPGKGNLSGTLVNGIVHLIEENTGERLRPGIVHRIDKDTSGILVVARTTLALQFLAKQFADHSIERIYWALVWGEASAGRIDQPLGRDPHNRLRFSVRQDGKWAVTNYRCLAQGIPLRSGEGGRISLVQCQLETGRTHQIRVHMKHIGHPLVGDPTYGRKKSTAAWKPILQKISGQLLHAKSLGFLHPNGERMQFSVPPPEIFQEVMRFAHIESPKI